MKRVPCPKCDNYTFFDETKYVEGQTLVFVCEHCKKQFAIRIGRSRLRDMQREEDPDKRLGESELGSLIVIENAFAFKQAIPLTEGDHLIGRRSKDAPIDIPIETSDPSMDRRHCYLHVKRNKLGEVVCTLRDNQSITGTFLHNELLGPKDRLRLNDGDVFTLGATSLILRLNSEESQ